MRVLVFGRTGQVATELRRHEGVTALGRGDADLTDPEACAAVIRAQMPQAVVNAAAYTNVDGAETDEATATRINGAAPAAMSRACAALDIPFVQISTDYVFDGQGSAAFSPDAVTAPLGAYGRSKLVGEKAVQEAGGPYAILRTAWVFSAHGRNFVKTMLALSETRDALEVVDDQIGGPTPADAIAAACMTIARQLSTDRAKTGCYHFSGAPDVSWKAFACETFRQAGRSVNVTGIAAREYARKYPAAAARPANSQLDCTQTQAVFGLPRPDWQAGLARVLAELKKETT